MSQIYDTNQYSPHVSVESTHVTGVTYVIIFDLIVAGAFVAVHVFFERDIHGLTGRAVRCARPHNHSVRTPRHLPCPHVHSTLTEHLSLCCIRAGASWPIGACLATRTLSKL